MYSVTSASSDRVISGEGAATLEVSGKRVTRAIVDVPQVAVVDGVVVVAGTLGLGVAKHVAATVAVALHLEELVIDVLLVTGQSSAPDVAIDLLLVEGVDTARWGGSV